MKKAKKTKIVKTKAKKTVSKDKSINISFSAKASHLKKIQRAMKDLKCKNLSAMCRRIVEAF